MEFNQVNMLYHRATNFRGYKISKILWIFQNLKNILEIVKSYSSTEYYLLILKNLFTQYSV